MPLVFVMINTRIKTLAHTGSLGTSVNFAIEYFEVEIAANRYADFRVV